MGEEAFGAVKRGREERMRATNGRGARGGFVALVAGAACVSACEATTAGAAGGVSEEMPAVSGVAGVIRRRMPALRACYERASGEDPQLRGRLDVQFTIGTNGLVTRIHTRGFERYPAFTACVVNVFVALRFPAMQGGDVDFTYPFNFAPGG